MPVLKGDHHSWSSAASKLQKSSTRFSPSLLFQLFSLPSHYLHLVFFSAVPNNFDLCQVPSYSSLIKPQTFRRAFLH